MKDYSVEEFSKSFFEELEELEKKDEEEEREGEEEDTEKVIANNSKWNYVKTITFPALIIFISIVITLIILNNQEIKK